MLLPTMTYKEMYDNLSKDLKKVKIREDYFLPKAIKEFKRKEDSQLGGGMNTLYLHHKTSILYFFMLKVVLSLKNQKLAIIV